VYEALDKADSEFEYIKKLSLRMNLKNAREHEGKISPEN